MNKDYQSAYEQGFNEATEYQDFITNYFLTHFGIVLTNYSSKYYQNSFGENTQKTEIKFDKLFYKTGNLYIEIAEKSNPDKETYTPSGIYRDNWFYIIGDYQTIFYFSNNNLRLLHKKKYINNEIKTDTSKGFLLPIKDIENSLFLIQKIEINNYA